MSSKSSSVVNCPDEPQTTVSPEVIILDEAPEASARGARRLWDLLSSEGNCWFDASILITLNQMSQMLLLLPSCVAQLGWWTGTFATLIFGLMSCWTAHIVQVFFFLYFPGLPLPNDDENIQWDMLLYGGLPNDSKWKHLGILGMVLNCLCVLARSTIQFTYAVSILYFIYDKKEKRVWTFVMAACCVPFALFPTFRNYRVLSYLSFVTATVAALCITAATLLHVPVQGIKHSTSSNSFRSVAWVCGIIVYTFGDTSAAVETLVTIKGWNNKHRFIYSFCASTGYTMMISLLVALFSYRAFGDELTKISPASQPCALAVLPPSRLRDIASILLLILELVTIGYSLHPLFMCLQRVQRLLPCIKKFSSMARISIVGSIFILAVAFPFSGSMEITALVGSLMVSIAIYIIPTAAYMLYFQHHQDVDLRGFPLIASYMINLILFAGVLIIVVGVGGLTSIKRGFLSHQFGRSDFWNKCYLCAYLQPFPALPPTEAPPPTHSLASFFRRTF